MAGKEFVLLAEKFPIFSFAGEADRWLASINPSGKKRKPLLVQLKERRVTQFETRKIIGAGLDYTPEGDFKIVFNDLKPRYFPNDAFVIGHELGHTFGYDLTETPPAPIVDHKSLEFSYYDARQQWKGCYLEDLCDTFADQWLFRNGKELIVKACKNQYSTIHGYNVTIDPCSIIET